MRTLALLLLATSCFGQGFGSFSDLAFMGGPPPVPSWQPTDAANLAAYFRAQDLANYTEGASLTNWPDAGPSGYNATNTTGSYLGTATLNAFGSYAAFKCNASSRLYLKAAAYLDSFRNLAGVTVGAVVNVTTNEPTQSRGIFAVSTGVNAANPRFSLMTKNGGLALRGRRLDADTSAEVLLGSTTNVSYRIIASADYVAGKLYIWTNGVWTAGATNSLTTSGGNCSDTAALDSEIGFDSGYAGLYGQIGAVVIYRSVWSDSIRTNLDNYLKQYVP